jgi:beta-glucanase (GH16 family)
MRKVFQEQVEVCRSGIPANAILPAMRPVLILMACSAFPYAADGQPDTVTFFRGVQEKWELAFADEFDGNRIDHGVWQVMEGVPRDPWQEHSQHWFDPDMVRVRGGMLELSAEPDTVKDRPFSIWITDRMVEMKGDYNFIAGEIDSREKFHYGMFEVRCKLPKGRGLCPAFWIYGEEDGVNHEIDIFEFWNQGSLFRDYDERLLSRVQNMSVHHRGRMSIRNAGRGPDYSADFHTFSVIWDECAIRWYTDGKLKRVQYRWQRMKGRMKGCDGITDGGKEQVFPQAPGQIILDVAVLNREKSPDRTNTWPQTMTVDYVKYYKRID